jgi:predicted AAA+ superfamily ATPase
MTYQPRLFDQRLDQMMAVLPAIAIEGAKGVGKTATASRRAADIFSLDREGVRRNIESDSDLALAGAAPTFIDEWQLVPPVWDSVRRAVDAGAPPGRFLLAGSAQPAPGTRIHSGAGRIVRALMRPLALPERGGFEASVSFQQILRGGRPPIGGATAAATADYVDEILRSGFPGIRRAAPEARGYLLDSYLDRIVDRDLPEAGRTVRRPTALRAWLAAYGAATATTASYSAVLAGATAGGAIKPSKVTATAYRELLQRIWVLDPLPAWTPTFAHLKRLGQAPKHHLVDPALAARLVGATASSLIRAQNDPPIQADGTFLGALFESLAVQALRVLADLAGAAVFHLRADGGAREVDAIVQRPDLGVVAVEVKLSSAVRPADVAQLNWLDRELPGRVIDKLLVNTGPQAHRRPDGVAVIPLALLGP